MTPSSRRRAAGTVLATALAASGAGLLAPATSAAPVSHPGLASVTRYEAADILFPGNDGHAHTVTFDKNSFMVDGTRLNIWSGEIHYWRLPDVNGWRDVFQKMRANGYNAVSLYMFWGMHQSEEGGDFDFTPGGVKDIDLLLTLAEQEGLYVIARPGPYVNAEISMGGLPAYMSNYGGGLRSTDARALAASKSWLSAVNAIIRRHQVTDGGGSVLLYQVENELTEANSADTAFLAELTRHVRADGITVPLFHNDWGLGGRMSDTSATGLDLYAYDSYPVGFNCSAPRNAIRDSEAAFHAYAPGSPNFITESQGGAFTPWGASYNASDCYGYTDPDFTRQWGVNNIGNGVTAFNFYMGFGGTNWGWTGSPASGFTSYDYGAGITEDRVMTEKSAVQKEIGYYARGVPALPSMDAVEAPAPADHQGDAVSLYSRQASDTSTSVTGHGTRTIAARLRDSNSTTETTFTIPLSLGTGRTGPTHSLTHDDRDPAITYTGSWQQVEGTTASKATLTRSSTPGDTAALTFTGTGVRLVTSTGTDHGEFTVRVDDADPVTVSSTRVDTEQNKPTQFVAFEATDLAQGEHTVTVTNTSGAVLGLDAFDVVTPQATQPVTVGDDDPAITYTGSWTHASGRPWTQGDLGGNETFSRTAGDSYEYTFTGVGLDLIAPFSGNHGSATVSVDGTVVGRTQESTVTGTEPVKTVFSWRAPQGQAPAPHTVRVTVDGTPFPGSSDTFVSLDAIRYYPDTSALPGSGETEPGTVSWPRVPQKEGTSLTLHGRDALLLTADQRIGTHELYYTTSQILGAPLDTQAGPLQYLVGRTGDEGETVLHYDAEPTVTGEGVEHTWDAARGELRLNYRHTAGTPLNVTVTRAGATSSADTLTLRVIDRTYAKRVWLLDGTRDGVLTTTAVEGAEVGRTVHYADGVAHVTGSLEQAGDLSVVAPAGVSSVTWNGAPLGEVSSGTAHGSAPGPQEVAPQALSFVSATDDAEAATDYDDSAWTSADATTSRQSEDYPGILRYPGNRDRNQQGPGSYAGVVLDSNHYGFHSGSVWYRAHYTAASSDPTLSFQATASKGAPAQGRNPGFAQVWVNGQYAGALSATGDWQSVKAPAGAVRAGQRVVVAVLVNNLGLSLDWNNGAWGSLSQSKENRGLYDAALDAQGAVTWRINGATTASVRDTATNPSGTVYNNGGLGGERAGWHMPALQDSSWERADDLHAARPGVTWYRSHVTLDVPDSQDTAWHLDVSSSRLPARADHSQVTLFVNGWNTGVYIGDAGPQSSFTIPSAFLNHHGDNVIALAVAAKEAGAGPESVSLVPVHSSTVPTRPQPSPGPDPTPGPSPSPSPSSSPAVSSSPSPSASGSSSSGGGGVVPGVMPVFVARVAADGTGSVLVGDWDGDGVRSYGVRVGSRVVFYSENSVLAAPVASLSLGRVSDRVFVGDWDGDGRDTLALVRGRSVFYQQVVDSSATTAGRVPEGELVVARQGDHDVLIAR